MPTWKSWRNGLPPASCHPTSSLTWNNYALNIGGNGFPGKDPRRGLGYRDLDRTDLERTMYPPTDLEVKDGSTIWE